MADYPVPQTHDVVSRTPPSGAALIVYAMFAIAAVLALAAHGLPLIAPLFGILGVVAVIIAYVNREAASGTWVASHLRWLIRTFWFSLLWAIIGWMFLIVLGLFLIGIPIAYGIWLVDTIWVIYRVVRGVFRLKDAQPMPGM
jgi:uncharacterized membrane protein